MKRLLLPFIALAVFTAALAGCGQKGPLYLPDDDKTVTPAASASAPSPAQNVPASRLPDTPER